MNEIQNKEGTHPGLVEWILSSREERRQILKRNLGVGSLRSRRPGYPSQTRLRDWRARFQRAGFHLDTGDMPVQITSGFAEGVEYYSDELGNSAEIRALRGASREASYLEVTVLLAEV